MGSVANPVPAGGLSGDVLLLALPFPPAEKWLARLKTQHPELEVRWVQQGIAVPSAPLPEELYEGVTMLCSLHTQPIERLQKVRYVQLPSAGADRWIAHGLYKNPDVIFCTANGAHSPQIAEWVMGTWLMINHHFIDYAEQQKKQQAKWLSHLQVTDSPGLRMGVLGYGAIGRQVARIAQALGMEVYAYTRSERSTPESRKDDSYCVAGTGDPDGLIPSKWFHGSSREAVNEFLAQDLDLLVLTLPLTESTTHILSAEQFDILSKKKTFVSNVSRGGHIDQDALIEALKEGKIRGAALDVTDPEPLPEGHPLFSAPNLFFTPHVSWQTPHLMTRIQDILEKNLDNLSKGAPLINLMDRVHHY